MVYNLSQLIGRLGEAMFNKIFGLFLVFIISINTSIASEEEYARKQNSNIRFQLVTVYDFNSLVSTVNYNAKVFNDFIDNVFNPNVDKVNNLISSVSITVNTIQSKLTNHDNGISNLQNQINNLNKLSTDANDIAFLKAEVAQLKKEVASIRRGGKGKK